MFLSSLFHMFGSCSFFSFWFLYLIFFHNFGEVFFRFFRFIHFLRTLFAGQKSWKVSSNTFSLRVLPVSVSASGSSRSSRQGVSGARPPAVAQRAAASATAAWNIDMAVLCNVLYMHYIWNIILCKQYVLYMLIVYIETISYIYMSIIFLLCIVVNTFVYRYSIVNYTMTYLHVDIISLNM